MASGNLSAAAQQIEAQLGQRNINPLQTFLRDETGRSLESKGLSHSEYDVYLVRRNKLAGEEVIGPKTLHTGKYSEDVLYGVTGSRLVSFLFAVRALGSRAETATTNQDETEYGHQVALVWTEVGRLKEFLGASPVVSELVAEFRTARFQFLGIDTPRPTMKALSAALHLVANAQRFDTSLVDRVVEAMEAGGIDPLAQDSTRDSNERRPS